MPKSTTPFTAPQKPVGANPNCDSNGCDYRKGTCVTPVKDQGQCGSCWAFSATESVETAQCMVGNGLDKLSPQQLVDCASTAEYGN